MTSACDCLRQMMRSTHTRQNALSRKMGKADNYIAATLKNDSDMRLSTLCRAASAMGYSVVLERDGERIRVGGSSDTSE